MLEKPVRSFLLYKLCNVLRNAASQKSAKDILLEIFIAEKIEDIINE